MSDFLQKWAKSLNMQFNSRLRYETEDLLININRRTSPLFDKSVSIFDLDRKQRLDNYDWRIFYNIAEPNIEVNLEDDKYLSLLLIRISADIPFFLKRKEELKYFDLCLKKDFFVLPKKSISINDCEVFHFRSVSEVRFNRPGKDDRFEITEINAWYIKYRMAIIENSYLQSLIPPFQKSNKTEHIYSSTAIGKEIMTFIKDDDQTKILQKEFKMELLT